MLQNKRDFYLDSIVRRIFANHRNGEQFVATAQADPFAKGGKFHATEHAVVVPPKEGIDTSCLFYLLIHLNLNQYATGQAQPGLSVENLEKVEIKISVSEKEQQKIAIRLSSLDELIAAQAEKIEALKEHKKRLMQGLIS